MINKLLLFFDSIKRLTLSQLFYLINKKVINRVFVSKISFSSRLEKFYSNSELLKKTDLFVIYDKSNIYFNNHYFEKLKTDFEKTSAIKIFDKIWTCDNNFEIQNNYRRFHLFSEASINSPEKLIIILEKWISKTDREKKIFAYSFNCSLRVFNWVKIIHLLLINGLLAEDLNKRLQQRIFNEVLYINNNIEHHIPGNHIILQYFVQWLIYSIFTNFPKSSEYKSYYETLLNKEIRKEFLDNGFHFEQSTHYHIQITLMCLYFLRIKTIRNEVIEHDVKNTIEKAIKIINSIVMPNGLIPLISDNCFNFFNPNHQMDICEIYAIAEELELNYTNRFTGFYNIENQYIIYRDTYHHLIFDCGNIGLNCNPGHGHSDILSFVYSNKNSSIFIDPGTRNYSNSNKDLSLKKSINHNTVSINNEDQAKLWGFFRWAFLPDNPKYYFRKDLSGYNISASYKGFKHIGGYKHSRQINLTESGFTLLDEVSGGKINELEINFILDPKIQVNFKGSCLVLSDGDFTYKLKIKSNFYYTININEIYIYPNYDYSIKSHKISIKFKPNSYKFSSKISLSSNLN